MPYLYHATYAAYLPEIEYEGLISGKHVSYQGSNPDGCVYLCRDGECAISFAEAADNVPDEIYDSGIVLLTIDSDYLDEELFEEDGNVLDGDIGQLNIAYPEAILPDAIIGIQWV